jgi:hypothetical protein
MPLSLEDGDGRPWTASAPLGWIVLITALSFGAGAVVLGLYLSLWIRSKGRSSLPLYGYLSVAGAMLAGNVIDRLGLATRLFDQFSMLASLLLSIIWIACTYYLRNQIQRYYRENEGWEIEIGPFFTLLFSTIYINYCLGPVTLSEKEPVTSLDLNR